VVTWIILQELQPYSDDNLILTTKHLWGSLCYH